MNTAHPLPPTTGTVLRGYKLPLTKIKEGHGYYGTLAYDPTKTYTQCFICGYFYKGLSKHIRNKHDLAPSSYKLQYGLPAAMSLAAPIQKQIYRASQEPEQRIANLEAGRQSISHEARVQAGQTKKSLYQRNLEGRCPDQTIERLAVLQDKLKRPPTRREFVAEYGWGAVKVVRNLFGSWGEAIRLLDHNSANMS